MTKEDRKNRNTMITNVAEAIVAKRLVLFIGAGFAMNARLPSWRGLLEKMKEQFVSSVTAKRAISKLINYGLFSDAAERIAKESTEDQAQIKLWVSNYFDSFNEDDNRNSENPSYRILLKLIECGATKIVTTNYDKTLQVRLPSKINVFSPQEDDINKIRKSLIEENYYIKLHGSTGDNYGKIVLFEKDYRDTYLLDDKIPNLLQELFTHNRILFLGCNLTDKYIDIFEKLKLRNAVLSSYVVCQKHEHGQHDKLVERTGIQPIEIDDYREFPDILKDILDKTQFVRQKLAKQIMFSDLPLEKYDYKTAEQFFGEVKKEEVIGCCFFNTQVEFYDWFSPSLQLHLTQQMEAGVRRKGFSHYRILFLPFTKIVLHNKLKDDDKHFLHGIKAMVKIHLAMNCKLVFITSDVFSDIINKNKAFFDEYKSCLGLDNLNTNDLSDLEDILTSQTHNGYGRKNDLDFSVVEFVNNSSIREMDNVQIWQANYEDDGLFKYIQINEEQEQEKTAYFKLYKILMSHINDNVEMAVNPCFKTTNRNKKRLSNYLDIDVLDYK